MARKKRKSEELSPSGNNFVTIYVMGEAYRVPKDLTIMKAMESAGDRAIRGWGCRGGVCGACVPVWGVHG
ncbi:MAG: 2Fe-2S iron-sulfur cluster binding domain-containing protein, partial [candidate division WOR-3 bacterium]